VLPEVAALESALGEALEVELRLKVAREAVEPTRLSPGEQSTYRKLSHTPRAHSWLLGRAALKSLRLEIDGEAETAGLRFPNARFSLAHSRDLAVAVTATSRCLHGIGVDVEIHRRVMPSSARFFLTPREQQWLESLSTSVRSHECLRLWCIKEAVFKANPANDGKLLADHEMISPGRIQGQARTSTGRRIDYVSWCRGDTSLALAVCR
jgi:phosphopantetheinyl transferase (holo-ACP synthase)